jgi:hypothetical protein
MIVGIRHQEIYYNIACRARHLFIKYTAALLFVRERETNIGCHFMVGSLGHAWYVHTCARIDHH